MKLRKIILLMKSGWTQLFLFPKDDRSVIIGNVTIKFFASLLILFHGSCYPLYVLIVPNNMQKINHSEWSIPHCDTVN